MDKSVFYLLVSDAFWYSLSIVLTCIVICLFWFSNKCLQRRHENTIFGTPQPSVFMKIIRCLKKHTKKERII